MNALHPECLPILLKLYAKSVTKYVLLVMDLLNSNAVHVSKMEIILFWFKILIALIHVPWDMQFQLLIQ
jgi:hypothetical protein